MSKKNKKCPYTDTQLSMILSAKAGRQLCQYGSGEFNDNVGCINQVAFNEPSTLEAISGYGDKAAQVAQRFDNLTCPSTLSYEQLLRLCGA